MLSRILVIFAVCGVDGTKNITASSIHANVAYSIRIERDALYSPALSSFIYESKFSFWFLKRKNAT